MKEITILSGKGGTGKTSITAALASFARNTVFCDNDVDAADLHLILQPKKIEEHTFFSGWKAFITPEECTDCNLCVNYCRFNAIHLNKENRLEINPFQCEGCRLCERICPEKAIVSERQDNNYWFVSITRFGTLVHAHMGPGEENSGKLVTQLRKKSRDIAMKNDLSIIINDGPPGIGCAAISSLSGTDLALMIIEPTKSGLHDIQRLYELIISFKIKAYAVINKFNINSLMTEKIEYFLAKNDIPLIAKVPFDKQFIEAMIEGKTIVEYKPESNVSKIIKEIWDSLKIQ